MHFDHKVGAIAYAEDGQLLLVMTEEPSLRAIRTASKETAWVLNKDNDVAVRIRTVAVAEGAPLLMGSWDGQVHELDGEGNIQLLTAAGTSGVTSTQVSPDRSTYVIARENGDLELCQFQWNDSITPVYASRSRIWDVHFADSGDQVLIACADGFLRHVPLPKLQNRGLRTVAFLDDDVHRIIPSADGNLLYAGSESTLAVIDVVQGKCVKKKGEFPSRVFTLALSLDERYLATGEESGRVCVWDAQTLECLKERPGFRAETQTEPATAEAVVFTANAEILVVGHGDTLAQWNWAKDEILWRTEIGFGQIIDMAQLSDGRVLLACSDGLVGLRPIPVGLEEYFRWETLSDNYRICAMRGSPNAFVGARDGSIQRIVVDSGSKEFRDTVTPKRAIDGMAIDPKGDLIALGGTGGELCLVDAAHFSVMSTTVLEGNKIRSTAFSPNGETLFVGLSDGSILAKSVSAMEDDTFIDPSSEFLFHCASPNGELTAVCDRGPWLKLFESHPLQRRPSWVAKDFWRASFSPDGTEIILAAEDRIYRARIDTLDEAPEHVQTVSSTIKNLCHITDDRVLFQDETLSLRSVTLNEPDSEELIWDATEGKVERWAVSPGGRTLAIGTVSGSLHLLDLEISKRSSVEVKGRIRALAFTPDRVRLAVGTEHGEIRFLNTSTRQWGSILHYPENAAVRDIAFADDGRTMLTTSVKEGMQLWDLETGEVVYELDTDFRVASLTYVPSTDMIIACGQDPGNRGVLRIHRTTPSR
jgi:WD40 repeat protein